MTASPKIQVIDLFAGPGGLGEGFSSVIENAERSFDIKLSIEMNPDAHNTLELRSFYRQFKPNNAPKKYYEVLKESNLVKREEKKRKLYKAYPKQYVVAKEEAWLAELGSENLPAKEVDDKIENLLDKRKNWVLIGGPPCQAFSLVGRSRVGGIDKDDHRVYLYKEYLRIIAVHKPAVFVMENVKGLLSAKVKDEKVFDLMLGDLQNPSQLYEEGSGDHYNIYSLSTHVSHKDENNIVHNKDGKSYLIKSENYGIPQKRHRVILLGVRKDIKVQPGILKEKDSYINLIDVIDDLPKLRSGLNRTFIGYDETYQGNAESKSEPEKETKKKRLYRKEFDSDENWLNTISKFRNEILSGSELNLKDSIQKNENFEYGVGSEFIKCRGLSKENPLYDWYVDEKIGGVTNHISRSHLTQDLKRYLYSSIYSKKHKRFPRLKDFNESNLDLLPDHENVTSGKFTDRFRVQLPHQPATTVTSHISKDGHYFIHYDPDQCRSLTVREAARIQTFPDNYLFCGSRTAQYHQVGNAVPPYLAKQIAEIVKDVLKKID